MKLNIKNLKGEVFQVELEPADTIATLKSKIHEVKKLPADSLKVVFKGKTMSNEDTIQQLGIKDTDFLVVMGQVAKPAPKAKQENKPQSMKEQKKEQQKEEKKQETQPQLSQVQQNQVTELMNMGFPRDQCVAALRAAFFNTETAVEYLCTGIPAGLDKKPQSTLQQSFAGLKIGSGEDGQAQLAALFNHPNFTQLKNLIRANPAAIQPILAQISQTSPQIYNLIAQYPYQFQKIVQGGDDQEQDLGQQGFRAHQVPAPGTLFISPTDQAAINRLKQLGFSKAESAQAYFACDKNEEMAANLLFDRLANGDIEMQHHGPVGNSQSGGQGGPKQSGSGSSRPNQDN